MAFKKTCPTLKKVGDKEPIFVLRAQDITAPAVVQFWAILNAQCPEKRAEAYECAKAMANWPTRKLAD